MLVDGALPRLQHILVVVHFALDATLVLEFGQFSGTLLVHDFLEIAAHGAITLSHLTQDVGLVRLLGKAGLEHLVLVGLVLSVDLFLHVSPLVLLQPLILLLLFLVQSNFLLATGEHALQQVNTRGILTVPLLFTLGIGFTLLLFN